MRSAVDLLDLLAAIALGLAATGLSLQLMRTLKVLDSPDGRRTHSQVTPRGGGLGIALLAVWFLSFNTGHALWLIPAVAGVGLLDDFYPQPAWLRLALQMMLCSIAVVSMGDSWQAGPILLVRLLLCVLAVGLINSANFFDGRNGLLAGHFILLLFALPLLGIRWPLAWPLAGLWLGFMPFNFPRAKIFMGDVGSYFIGATLAWLVVRSAQSSVQQTAALLVAMSGMVADPTLTLLLRLTQGKHVAQAHRQHLYQLLARTGASDTKLLFGSLVYAALAVGVAWWITVESATNATLLMLTWCLLTSAAWLWGRKRVLHRYAIARRDQARRAFGRFGSATAMQTRAVLGERR